jgi:hypothetical protein
MKVYEVSWLEEGDAKSMTLYVSETGKLEEFIDDLLKKGCEVNEIKVLQA